MATRVLDRRIQRTRRLLQAALLDLILEKGYAAITVQEVIDRANVGRSTFYSHFRDKEELLLSEFQNLQTQFEQHLASEPAGGVSPWSLSLSMFQHAQSQRQLYKALAGKQGGDIALAHIRNFLSAFLREHLKRQLAKRKKRVPLEILSHYIASSFIALLTWWLDTDSPFSAEQMNDFYRQLVQPGVDAIMN